MFPEPVKARVLRTFVLDGQGTVKDSVVTLPFQVFRELKVAGKVEAVQDKLSSNEESKPKEKKENKK